ncbi:hypothetical protein ACEQ8H_004749 [Pleosporales sp. CAS-2024a]
MVGYNLDYQYSTGPFHTLSSVELDPEGSVYSLKSLSPPPSPRLSIIKRGPSSPSPLAALLQVQKKHSNLRSLPQASLAGEMDSGQHLCVSAEDDPLYYEASEDDAPIVKRRHTRIATKERRQSSLTRQAAKVLPAVASKNKKSGTKPTMKNDVGAKREVIREIQGYWGKGFIKAYIPQCHRPLVKRDNASKRSNREHEMNAMNWLPSVLKSILMIAKLTNDKHWLKQAMNDVVRYRIKHTGNRKPQLVTTDFDVIEDMLVKDWSVEYSFGIRYKHLLVKKKDEEENDENIDHMLNAGSDKDVDMSDEEDGVEEILLDNTDEEAEGAASQQRRGSTRSQYLDAGNHLKTSKHSSPALSRRQLGRPKSLQGPPMSQDQSEQPYDLHQEPGLYTYGRSPAAGNGLDPLINLWYQPMARHGHPCAYNSGYRGYKSCVGGCGCHGHLHGRRRPGCLLSDAHGQSQHVPADDAMTPALSIPGSKHSQHGNHCQQGQAAAIKDEFHIDDIDAPCNDLGTQDGDDEEILDDEEAIDAEVEAMEIKLKLAQLKVKRARLAAKRRREECGSK